jgi:hypothetical protein
MAGESRPTSEDHRSCFVAAQAQQHRASSLALVTAAIVLWKTVYLSRTLDVVRRRGDVVPGELLTHLAPLG